MKRKSLVHGVPSLIGASIAVLFLGSCLSTHPAAVAGVRDDFSDASYSSRRWNRVGTRDLETYQLDGAYWFTNKLPAEQPTEVRLVTKARYGLSDLRLIEARLSIEPSNGRFCHIALNALQSMAEGGEFWIEADLMSGEGRPVVLCRIGYSGAKTTDEHAFVVDPGLSYGAVYGIRIGFEPDGTVVWSIDGNPVHEFRSAELLRNASKPVKIVINSFRDTGAIASSRVEDVSIVLR